MVSIAGGLLSLDRTAAFQTMVSRPVVTAPVIGYLLGDAGAGLVVGITLELLFIGDLPVGKYVPNHETGLAVLSTAIAVTVIDSWGAETYTGPALPASGMVYGLNLNVVWLIPVVLLVAIPVSRLYQGADNFVRGVNRRFFVSAEAALSEGLPVSLMRLNLKGAGVFFFTNTAVFFVTIAPLMYASALLQRIWPEVTPEAFLLAFGGCAALGIAAAFNTVYTKKGAYIFPASCIAAALALLAAF